MLSVGGATGIALNVRLVRSWGFPGPAFATFTVVRNVWDVLVKLCLPAVALGWMLLSGPQVAAGFLRTTLGATLAMLLLSAGLVAVLVDVPAAWPRGPVRVVAAV